MKSTESKLFCLRSNLSQLRAIVYDAIENQSDSLILYVIYKWFHTKISGDIHGNIEEIEGVGSKSVLQDILVVDTEKKSQLDKQVVVLYWPTMS